MSRTLTVKLSESFERRYHRLPSVEELTALRFGWRARRAQGAARTRRRRGHVSEELVGYRAVGEWLRQRLLQTTDSAGGASDGRPVLHTKSY